MTNDEMITKACEMITQATGIKTELQPADRLHMAVVEALMWLEQGAPSRAHEVLQNAHKYHVGKTN